MLKTIKKSDQLIQKCLGRAKPLSTKYRLFSYLVAQPCGEGTLLYNVLTGEILLLDAKETAAIERLPSHYASWMDALIGKHFLVPESTDDMRTVKNMRILFRKVLSRKGIAHYAILPTTACNARCFYCFEKGVKPVGMSDETVDQAAAFIVENSKGQKVSIHWYGGEPLVGTKQIDRLSRNLKASGISFESHMSTNGFLFSKELAQKAVEAWHLTGVQIPMDGTEAVYNQIKAYTAACQSPYRTVLDNIRHLLDIGIFVKIRLNVGWYNVEDLHSLAEDLARELKSRSGFYVYSHTLLNNGGAVPMGYHQEDLEKLHAEKHRLDAALCSLQIGKEKELPQFRFYHCHADRDDYVMILPSGKLGKCKTHTEDFFVGSLGEGIVDMAEVRRQKETAELPQCRNCPLFPACLQLKTCAIQNECSETLVRLMLEDTKEEMLRIYKETLNNL